METKPINSWQEFEDELTCIDTFLTQCKSSPNRGSIVSEPLFRGHADAERKLKSTLERVKPFPMSVRKYYTHLQIARRNINSFPGHDWPEEEIPDLTFELFKCQTPPYYEFMAYLRHHGFPSPLIDWTMSPYVAAFFAFRAIPSPETKSVSVFCLLEDLGQGTSGSAGLASIVSYGPCASVHPRHFSQQSQYTLCLREGLGTKPLMFDSHLAAFDDDARTDIEQRKLIKLVFPVSLREEALKKIRRMNITPYTLFGSDESLVDTLSLDTVEKED